MRRAVICLGNLLRADDGVAIHLAERLRKERPDIEVVELPAGTPEILDYIRGRDRVVIVDAIRTGAKPGTIHRIIPQVAESLGLASSHGINLFGLLRLGQQLYPDEMPERLVILAVEAEDTSSFSDELTERVRQAIPVLLEVIDEEFEG